MSKIDIYNITDKDFGFWNFSHEIDMDSIVRCPECKEESKIIDWEEKEVYCEDCGTHAAIECPKCSDRIDHVWCPIIEVINPK